MPERPLQKIRAQGYRVTPQRQLILDAVRAGEGHLTAVEIAEMVQATVPSLNLATVYRTLDFLGELRLVAKTEINGQSVYEYVSDDPHHHLVCRGCGYEQELANHHFEPLFNHLMTEHGFKAEIDHLALSGLCADCQDS